MRHKSLRQHPYLLKIQENRLILLVDTKIAGVHVRLREHQTIIADLNRRHLFLDSVRELRVRLSQILC